MTMPAYRLPTDEIVSDMFTVQAFGHTYFATFYKGWLEEVQVKVDSRDRLGRPTFRQPRTIFYGYSSHRRERLAPKPGSRAADILKYVMHPGIAQADGVRVRTREQRIWLSAEAEKRAKAEDAVLTAVRKSKAELSEAAGDLLLGLKAFMSCPEACVRLCQQDRAAYEAAKATLARLEPAEAQA